MDVILIFGGCALALVTLLLIGNAAGGNPYDN